MWTVGAQSPASLGPPLGVVDFNPGQPTVLIFPLVHSFDRGVLLAGLCARSDWGGLVQTASCPFSRGRYVPGEREVSVGSMERRHSDCA